MNRPLKFFSRHWLATTALILAVSGSAMAAGTLVQIQANDALVATANPLPVTVVGSGGGGAATIADGADVTQGAKADAKSTATDTTAVTLMQVTKQISASVQAAAASLAGSLTVGTHAVTQSGTFTVQPGNTANTTPWLVAPTPAGGTAFSNYTGNVTTAGSGAGTGGVAVGSSGVRHLFGYQVYNGNSSVCYLQFLDQTQALTNLGTTVPVNQSAYQPTEERT
jgi:hypothetical protein